MTLYLNNLLTFTLIFVVLVVGDGIYFVLPLWPITLFHINFYESKYIQSHRGSLYHASPSAIPSSSDITLGFRIVGMFPIYWNFTVPTNKVCSEEFITVLMKQHKSQTLNFALDFITN